MIAVTAASLALALWGEDPQALLTALGAVRVERLPAVILVISLVFLARVARYHLLLGAGRPSFRRTLTVCGVGFLALNVLPLRLGEFVRPFMLLEDGLPWGRSLGAIVVERALDLLALLGMLVLLGAAVDLPSAIVVGGVDVLATGQRGVAVAVGVLLAGLVGLLVAGPAAAEQVRRLPGIGPRLAGFGLALHAVVRDLAANPLQAALAAGLAAAVWGLTVVSVWLLLGAFPGLPVTWGTALTVTAVTVAGTAAVPTPGMVGSFEVFCKAALVLWAVEGDRATAFALVWHAHTFGFHVLLGATLLLAQGLSLGALVRASRAPTAR